MTPQQANLAPCPFCGSQAEQFTDEYGEGIECKTCEFQFGPYTKLEHAIAAWNRRAPAPTEPAVDRDAVPLSPGRVMAITDAIIPGDDWDGNDWDHAVANRAFMAGFAERGRIMREINSMVESFDVATPASPAVPGKPRFKDHDIRQLVNDLRAIAIEFHAAGQLRERISAAVQQFLAGPQVAQASQWFSMADVLPPLGTDVLVRCDSWQRPMVLQYAEVPFQKLNDYANGKWYWAPESMHWMPIPASQPTSAEGKDSERLDWQPITAPGQVKVGDKLRFNIGDALYNETVKQVLDVGTDREELIYNKRLNYYVITRNAITNFGSSKNVTFQRASTGKDTDKEAK